ncbi:hypothetical protein KY314_03095 [Candidatus Woesearchaeota archaeon]|nr:hypothetical protein [Candidatus Woesearchaeota archaeon]
MDKYKNLPEIITEYDSELIKNLRQYEDKEISSFGISEEKSVFDGVDVKFVIDDIVVELDGAELTGLGDSYPLDMDVLYEEIRNKLFLHNVQYENEYLVHLITGDSSFYTIHSKGIYVRKDND